MAVERFKKLKDAVTDKVGAPRVMVPLCCK